MGNLRASPEKRSCPHSSRFSKRQRGQAQSGKSRTTLRSGIFFIGFRELGGNYLAGRWGKPSVLRKKFYKKMKMKLRPGLGEARWKEKHLLEGERTLPDGGENLSPIRRSGRIVLTQKPLPLWKWATKRKIDREKRSGSRHADGHKRRVSWKKLDAGERPGCGSSVGNRLHPRSKEEESELNIKDQPGEKILFCQGSSEAPMPLALQKTKKY